MLYAIWCVPVSKGNKVRLSLGIICAEQFCCMAGMGSYSGCDAVLVYFFARYDLLCALPCNDSNVDVFRRVFWTGLVGDASETHLEKGHMSN